MATPLGIHHLDLQVNSFAKTEDFYSHAIGWRIGARFGRKKNSKKVIEIGSDYDAEKVTPESLRIDLLDGSHLFFIVGKKPDYSLDEPHLALKVNQAGQRRILARLKLLKISHEINGGENVAFYDPSGLRIEIYQEST